MQKVIRDGQVAVLYSPSFGGGWYSWNKDHSHAKELLFHPTLVELVEQNRHDEITEELVCELFGLAERDAPYMGGARDDLRIEWIPEGTSFRIDEYDGAESVVLQDEDSWVVA